MGFTLETVALLQTTGEYYSFKNIPYAEAPVGELRFQAPVPRVTVNRTIDDGSNTRICHQASGSYFPYSLALVATTIATTCDARPNNLAGIPPTNASESEDCLLLDVHVPKLIWKHRRDVKCPVLVWIHGGGYTEGSKEVIEPAGQISRSLIKGKGGMIVVSINYRLGMFGFPPNKEGESEVVSNAGLYDQRLALEWVQRNIHRFGGDSGHVTVIGESAGGGSIIAQLAAFGGEAGSSPFQQAIIQSAGLKPLLDSSRYSKVYEQFLSLSGVSNYSEAAELPLGELKEINKAMVALGPFADTVFSPNVDGTFIPDLPARLLYEGRLDRSVELIVSHNTAEGVLFSDPRVQDDEGFKAFFRNLLSNLSPQLIDKMATEVYPPDFSGTQPYKTHTERLVLAVGESLFDCNAFGLNLAYNNRTRGYLFGKCPGLHAQDVSYTLYRGQATDVYGLPLDGPTAEIIQDWLVDFTLLGDVVGSSARQMPIFGEDARVLQVRDATTPKKLEVVRDPSANHRCRFWLEAAMAETEARPRKKEEKKKILLARVEMNINPFRSPSRPEAEWFSVGLASTFPDVGDDGELSRFRSCNAGMRPGCKVFYSPKTDNSKREELSIEDDSYLSTDIGRDLKDQVLVFQHRGKFHAIDHRCPHSSYPLSKGVPFDIEDFGVVLSAGLTCPKHGWSFDVFSGMSDRGHYKLGVWEVQLRDVPGGDSGNADMEVWVRRKQRMG
ncbi:hypothetical protein jhhlp_006675 [Lomentospora prolificans]|uniref:Rieske domain-containing protein n=1 Tax=Lomentospora prolificans TaxID=41688 RepID=A0A2N3N6I5_9PEZI|nr:hypothetical protein jhhlp_006675 [Lomentospora prolificans]